MSLVKIANGTVYDPTNNLDGVVQDIWIQDGKIVAPPTATDVRPDRTLDATGLVVMAGGVDMHAHIAGPKVNLARKMRPEDKRLAPPVRRTPITRSGTTGSVPSTFATGYLYAGMGFTTVNEAAMPIMSAKHTHEELRDTPIVDKTCLVLMANNEIVMDLLEAGDFERAKDVVAWQVWASKAYGVKAVNPGGVANWKWGKDAKQLSDPIDGYSKVTPGTIVSNLARIVAIASSMMRRLIAIWGHSSSVRPRAARSLRIA